MGRKQKPLPPRRKRTRRAGRLQSARQWLASYGGKHVVRSYARWYGVDLACALKELQMLEVVLDPDYAAHLKVTLAQRLRRPPRKTVLDEETLWRNAVEGSSEDCWF